MGIFGNYLIIKIIKQRVLGYDQKKMEEGCACVCEFHLQKQKQCKSVGKIKFYQ